MVMVMVNGDGDDDGGGDGGGVGGDVEVSCTWSRCCIGVVRLLVACVVFLRLGCRWSCM